jgi:hypothetical protein
MRALFVELPTFERLRNRLEFWLFTLYDKNELSDLSKNRATLEGLLKIELKMSK